MNKLPKILFILFFAFQSYSRVLAQALPDTAIVTVLDEGDGSDVPRGAKLMGKIKVVDGGFKINCGYDETIESAKEKARAKGANVVKITELREPGTFSSCYQLHADVYYYEGAVALASHKDLLADSIAHALIPDTASYALLYVYRPRGGVGPIIRYALHVDDSEVCMMKMGSAYIIRLYNNKKTKVWARTESEVKTMIDVAPRKVYFLRTTVKMGLTVGRPDFNLVSTQTGLREFNKIVERNEEKDRE